jgi:hypothetical protein
MQSIADKKIATATFVKRIERTDGKSSFVLFGTGDIAEAATGLLRDAMRCLRPAPTILPELFKSDPC